MLYVKTREAQFQPRYIQVKTREAQTQPRKDHIEAREAQVQTKEALVIFHKRAAVALGALLKSHSTGIKNNVEINKSVFSFYPATRMSATVATFSAQLISPWPGVCYMFPQ